MHLCSSFLIIAKALSSLHSFKIIMRKPKGAAMLPYLCSL